MRTAMDKAGRVVIPKALRERLGLRPGEVEVYIDGTSLRLEAVSEGGLEEHDGRLFIPATGAVIDDVDVQVLRDAEQA